MKEVAKLGFVLTLVTVLAAAGLAMVYSITKPRIDAQGAMETESALIEALPQIDPASIEAVRDGDEIRYYRALDSDSQYLAFAYIASGSGYSSVIKTMVGVDKDGTLIGLKVLSQTETPGLGTKVEEIKYGEADPWFLRQFLGKKANGVAVKADGGEIVSITGATISSRALTKSVANGYTSLLKRLEADSAMASTSAEPDGSE
ncbi:MAG TPA: RnfABCDGE type electron transport complex subunit G [bacterium]|jgi:electron transport complex protein RnfG|nr:RnfABCDGE type electron transport complex subunit G [bacterium]HNT65373.1 RnfABCDGE type electron transport complex subunit G [bacterium]